MPAPAQPIHDPNCLAPPLDAVLDRRFVRSLIRFETLRTGCAVYDEDLEQEALLRLWVACRRVHVIRHPRAFAAKVVRDTVRQYWRRRAPHVSLDSVPETLASYTLAVEKTIDHKRRVERLQVSLRRLAERTRITLQLFYVEDASVPVIAASLSLSPSAVKMILLRGRRTLRRLLRFQSV